MPTKSQRCSYQNRVVMNWKIQELMMVNTISNKAGVNLAKKKTKTNKTPSEKQVSRR